MTTKTKAKSKATAPKVDAKPKAAKTKSKVAPMATGTSATGTDDTVTLWFEKAYHNTSDKVVRLTRSGHELEVPSALLSSRDSIVGWLSDAGLMQGRVIVPQTFAKTTKIDKAFVTAL